MPGNYILMYSSPAGKKQEEILAKAEEEITGIVGPVTRCEKRVLPSSLLSRLLHTLLYGWFARTMPHTDDRKFSVNDKCTSCGTCVAICPAGNIELVEGKPVWKHHCELCCGCIHLCPVQAIQAGSRTGNTTAVPEPVCNHCGTETKPGRKTMKTIIYYFTGTGNSLAAAKKIAAVLGDCTLVPIASLQDHSRQDHPGGRPGGDCLPGL